MLKLTTILLIVALLSCPAYGQPERYYQLLWCQQQNGVMEHRLDDGTRIDCLTDTHAIEFDFARKWAESIGQSLYYAGKTGKQAGVVLIGSPGELARYLPKLQAVADEYGIMVWVVHK